MMIRRARVDDFLAIAALDREAWRENRHSDFIPDGEHVWRAWVEHALVWCAQDGERIVGAVLAFPCTDGSYWLHKVFVARDRRGDGIGSRLFEGILAELDRLHVEVSLTVDPVNKAAIALYEKWGFTQSRLEPGYYREHEDRLVLTRPHV